MPNPTPSNIDPLYVKLPAELHKRLRSKARRRKTTKSTIVINALIHYLLLIDRSEEN